MPKFTSVNSEIKEAQKKALKEMTPKQKLAYFWEYYKVHTLVSIGAVILITWIAHDFITARESAFYAIMLNSYNLNGEAIGNDFSEYIELDTEEYLCYIDTTSVLDPNDYTEYNMATSQKIMALAQTGDLDTIISDGNIFGQYAGGGFFGDLRTFFSEEELAAYQGHLYYIDMAADNVTSDDSTVADESTLSDDTATADTNAGTITPTEEELAVMEAEMRAAVALELESHRDPTTMKDPVPVGIYMTEAAFFKANNGYPQGNAVFGIVLSSMHSDNARSFLEYLWSTAGPEGGATGGAYSFLYGQEPQVTE
ncbi:MAG: hypothetical protein LBV33_05940 [Lachnospiraceae bacterium]|jgi:hypothetical protein|nr:hypothetical protein [Lachnospiraceae bacterium]